MSILWSDQKGWIISHDAFLSSVYINDFPTGLCIRPCFDVFHIWTSFSVFRHSSSFSDSTRKRKKPLPKINTFHSDIREKFDLISRDSAFFTVNSEAASANNELARSVSDTLFRETATDSREEYYGRNTLDEVIKVEVNNGKYLLPPQCEFYCYDTCRLREKLIGRKFDLIVVDPPWWNKSVRRKKEGNRKDGYNMMYNEDVASLPIDYLLDENGIVCVWCTNAKMHVDALLSDILPKWNVEYRCTWYWIKVTLEGKPVCDFSNNNQKQPYERIIIARKIASGEKLPPSSENKLTEGKLIVSVPSGVHSHKPPLHQVMKECLSLGDSSQPRCLEIFARCLIPGWCSWGNEVLKLQHESFFARTSSRVVDDL